MGTGFPINDLKKSLFLLFKLIILPNTDFSSWRALELNGQVLYIPYEHHLVVYCLQPAIWSTSWGTYMQVRKQQLELDMEQQTGAK